eukprot:Opistho-2@2945
MSLKQPVKRVRPWSMCQPTHKRMGTRQQMSGSMIAREWILVNEEADDFRYGIQPVSSFTKTVKLRTNDTLGEASPRNYTRGEDITAEMEALGIHRAESRAESMGPVLGARRDDPDLPLGASATSRPTSSKSPGPPVEERSTRGSAMDTGKTTKGGSTGRRKGEETVLSKVTVSKQLRLKRVADMEKEISPKPASRLRDLNKPMLREVIQSLGLHDSRVDLKNVVGGSAKDSRDRGTQKKPAPVAGVINKWGTEGRPHSGSGAAAGATTGGTGSNRASPDVYATSEVDSFVSNGWIPPKSKRRQSDSKKAEPARYGPMLSKRKSETTSDFNRMSSFNGPQGGTPTDFEKSAEGTPSPSKSRPGSPSEKEIKKIAKDFVAWLGSLGGQDGVDEATIASLFSRNTEYQPAPMVPIHLVDPATVPVELRRASPDAHGTSSALSAMGFGRSILDEEEPQRPRFDVTGSTRKNVQRPKFGAWYLPTDLWKTHAPDAPLEDPKSSKDKKQTTTMRKKARELDATVAQLYGAQLYKEFIVQKGLRMPRFLEAVKTEINGIESTHVIDSRKDSASASSSDDESDQDNGV